MKKALICLFGVLGLIAAGLGIYQLAYFSFHEHYVSVKGIAETKVKADLALWEIGYKLTGNDLTALTKTCLAQQQLIVDFLTAHHFTLDEIELRPLEVIDLIAREYNSTPQPNRYIVTSGVVLRSHKIEEVRTISQKRAALIEQGIVLTQRYEGEANPIYLYTKLDTIRPQLLEQATKSAQLVAAQFAAHSGSRLGKIRQARQGVFQIMSCDSNAGNDYGGEQKQLREIDKMVRVVVSLDYLLD